MNSKIRLGIYGAVFLWIVNICAADTASVDRLRRSAPRKSLDVIGDVSKICKEALGTKYTAKEIYYWKSGQELYMELQAKGKRGLIVAGFFVEQGKIQNVKIISSKERRGRSMKTKSFLKQFVKLGLTSDKKLSRKIDAISGATISSRTLEKMARLTLLLAKMAV